MTELQDAIRTCAERLERFRRNPRPVGEQNTKVNLIEPIIGALGWDIHEIDEVSREYRRRGTDNPVDYALLLLRVPRLFIEAKGLGENLNDPRWANQTISYAAVAGVEWVALTNGAEWRIYNAHAAVPVEEKLLGAVRIDEDVPAAVDLLGLLSKENMRDNRINEIWRAFFVDRQVLADLTELFSSGVPAPELVSLIGHRLTKLNSLEIQASLARVRVTFDFPLLTTPPVTPHVVPVRRLLCEVEERPSQPSTGGRSVGGFPVPRSREAGNRRISAEERRLRVPDMIRAGRLRPGSPLHGDYLGHRHQAELLADGRVRYGGAVHSSLSAAGAAAGPLQGRDLTGSPGLG